MDRPFSQPIQVFSHPDRTSRPFIVPRVLIFGLLPFMAVRPNPRNNPFGRIFSCDIVADKFGFFELIDKWT
jgi:hypothetical protein